MAQDFTDDCFADSHGVQVDAANMEKNFAALKSSFSGPSPPPNPQPGMWWLDTTAHILKIRNEANSAWLSVWDMANNKPVISGLSGDITEAMLAAAILGPAAASFGLRKLGTSSVMACAGNDSRLSNARAQEDCSAGNIRIGSDDTEETGFINTTYVKVKELTIGAPGELRIKFDIARGSGGGTMYGRIYRNGSAVGTEQTSVSSIYATKSQDISGWSTGDLVQLYVKTSDAGQPVQVRNFRISVDTARIAY